MSAGLVAPVSAGEDYREPAVPLSGADHLVVLRRPNGRELRWPVTGDVNAARWARAQKAANPSAAVAVIPLRRIAYQEES